VPASSFAPIPVAPPAARRKPDFFTGAVAFVAAHVVLGIAASQVPMVATIHGALTALTAVILAFTSPRIDRIVAAAGYCAMCDVFWRMSKSAMPWEASKYLSLLVLLIAFFRFVKRPHDTQLPALYLALLVPSCLVGLVLLGPSVARDQISLNIAGPALLGVGVILMRQLIGTERELSFIFWAMVGPIIAIVTIATRSTITSDTLKFTSASNFQTSGGFGPNQVSTVLGLGVLVCILLSLSKTTTKMLALQVGIGAWFGAQALLTFSRGGLYSAGAGVIAIVLVAIATQGARTRVIAGIIIGLLVAVALFPSLNDFTGDAIGARFEKSGTSGRDQIANADFDLFVQSPLFGVGVGVAKTERANTATAYDVEAKAHTEWTRLLAEHGILGFVAGALLLVMAVQGIKRSTTRWNRMVAASCAAWSLVTMGHSATSVAAICFAFTLSQIRLTTAERT
jgi:O-antigen ligase